MTHGLRPLLPLLAVSLSCSRTDASEPRGGTASAATELALPPAKTTGTVALEAALARRRSIRAIAPEPLRLDEVGQLLWAAQGVTDAANGLRAAPSAGALFPLELYVARADGLFRYLPREHALARVRASDTRAAIAKAALDQQVVRSAPVIFVLTGVLARTRAKYGARAERFVTLEAGHAAQGLLLEATALGLAATPVGAFDDDALRAALGAGEGELPLYVVPVGRPAG